MNLAELVNDVSPRQQALNATDCHHFDLLIDWVPDEKVRYRVLAENPAILYDFPEAG